MFWNRHHEFVAANLASTIPTVSVSDVIAFCHAKNIMNSGPSVLPRAGAGDPPVQVRVWCLFKHPKFRLISWGGTQSP